MATFSSDGPKLDEETLGELGMLKILRELEELAESRMALLAKSTDFTGTNLSDLAFLAAYWPEDFEIDEIANEIKQLIHDYAPERAIAVDVDTFAEMDVDGLPDKVDPDAFGEVDERSDRALRMDFLNAPRPKKNKKVTRMIRWQKEYEKKLLARAIKEAVEQLMKEDDGRELVKEVAKIQSDLERKIDGR